MNLTAILSQVGVSQKMMQDVTLVLFVALASFVYGMLIGRYRLISALVNIYAAFAIVSMVPTDIFTDYTSKLILFFVLWGGLTFFSRKFFDIPFYGTGSSFLWRVFSMSFLEIALLLSITVSLVPKKVALGYVSTETYKYLIEGWAPLFWMAVPLVYLFFIHRKAR